MGSFKITVLSILGIFPETGKLEKELLAFEEEFKKFKLFAESDELKHFNELEKFVNSDEFEKEKQRIKALNFKNTEQFKQLTEFNTLKNSKSFKTYFSVKDSELLKFYQEFSESELLSKYNSLKSYFESAEYQAFLKDLEQKKQALIQVQNEFQSLSKKPELVRYFKIKNSKQLIQYQSIAKSDKLQQYQQLEEFVKSAQLAQLKDELNKKLVDFKNKQNRYKSLSKNKDIINFKKVNASPLLPDYQKYTDSGLFEKFAELEKTIKSAEFIAAKKEMKNPEFDNSEYGKLLQEYNQLKNDKKFQAALKFGKTVAYQNYQKTKQSELLTEFFELEKEVQTNDFEKQISDARFENKPEYQKEKDFFRLQKDADIKHYLKYSSSDDLKHFKEIDSSDLLTHYNELKELTGSEKFKAELKACEFNNTSQYNDLKSFEALKKDPSIVKYLKFENSNDFKVYRQVLESDQLKRYHELKATIESEDFRNFKTYMEDPKKWEKSEAFSKQTEFLKLKKDPTLKWYFNCIKKDKFKPLKQWNITFEDHFESDKLDLKKWLTSYFYGEVLLHEGYVLEKDKHYLTNGQNIEISNSYLKIITRKEKITGKSWTRQFGFMPKNFDYTSGIICSAHSFRQQYGKFEAKIKFSHRYPVYHAFWLKGDKITPEIDIAKYHHPSAGKLYGAYCWSENNEIKNKTFKTSGLNFGQREYIYTLIWEKDLLTWQINGVTTMKQKITTPNEPMYLVFCSGLTAEPGQNHLPAHMEVDWVRCYEKA